MNAVVQSELLPATAPGPAEAAPVLAAQATNPMTMLAAAFERGTTPEQLDKLLALQERWEANEARKAFVAAITQFKANPPTIFKTKRVYFEGKSGGVTDYMHATLADVCAAAIKGLAEVGISHRWELRQENGVITVSCILTHALGHSERTTLQGPPEGSGTKNPLQAVASTVTLLERYTLLAATGLAARDMAEDDGRGAGAAIKYITPEQVADLEALITEAGADRNKFLVWARVAQLEEIETRNYNACVTGLRSRMQVKATRT